MFKDIWKCRWQETGSQIKCLNGMQAKGSQIQFWKDIWTGDEELKVTFARLFSLAVDTDLSIQEMNLKWILDLLRVVPYLLWEWQIASL